LIIGIAVFTSLLLSVFFIILLEYIDNSIKTPYIFSKEVGLPLLGVINQVNLKKESLQQLLVQGQETEKVNPEFKDLLKKIRYEMDKKNSKLFLFTSNKPGEGKTTIITALSMVLASINKRILLIDTNFSHNSLTQLFGSTLALEDFGNLDFDEHYEVINKMIGKTSNKNIDIIGCKGGNYSPSEIFLKRGFFNALGKLTVYYDYIFLEGANLNQYADTKELAEFSDSVISVFSAKSIIKQSDINSITFLKELKESFGGAILNNVELDNIDY
jgi:Mrp family chromosome partitioning ATPase